MMYDEPNPIQLIEQKQLKTLLVKAKAILIDVREKWEFRDFNIGGLNIPPHEIGDNIKLLTTYKHIIVACSNGTRSHIVARLLHKKLPESHIYHLEEGVF